jgi:hypothetical protein
MLSYFSASLAALSSYLNSTESLYQQCNPSIKDTSADAVLRQHFVDSAFQKSTVPSEEGFEKKTVKRLCSALHTYVSPST